MLGSRERGVDSRERGGGVRGTYCYLTVHWAVLKGCRSFPGTPYK